MDDWNWNDIVVESGQWWLLLIVLGVLVVGLLAGWIGGVHEERKHWERDRYKDMEGPNATE